jgi:cytoskeletal protein CcmA (bactofilin family)
MRYLLKMSATSLTEIWDLEDEFGALAGSPIGAVEFSKRLVNDPSGEQETSTAGIFSKIKKSLASGTSSSNDPVRSTERGSLRTDSGTILTGVEIKGLIKTRYDLLIDGRLEGEIDSGGVVTIGENADVRGEIKTRSIIIRGRIQGNVVVTGRCELKARCVLQGDLKAGRLVIEEGATFVGKSEVTSVGGRQNRTPEIGRGKSNENVTAIAKAKAIA